MATDHLGSVPCSEHELALAVTSTRARVSSSLSMDPPPREGRTVASELLQIAICPATRKVSFFVRPPQPSVQDR